MARVTGPLMSMEASGSVGKTLVFARWKGRPYVRQWVKPMNPKSASQQGIRSMLGFLAAAWTAIKVASGPSYAVNAVSNAISSFNQYVKENMQLWRENLAPSQSSAPAKAHTGATISNHTYTPGSRHANLSFTLSTAANQWGIIILRKTVSITAFSWADVIAVVPVGGSTTINHTDSDIDAGTYHYRACAFTDDGVFGTLLADDTAVVTA
jgi:hypothetical protein